MTASTPLFDPGKKLETKKEEHETQKERRKEKGKEYLAQFHSSSLSCPPNFLTGLLFPFPQIPVTSFQQFVLACIHVEVYSSQTKI